MATTTLSTKNAALIQAHHRNWGQSCHDELSLKIREVFATELSDQEIKNAVNQCFAGKSYIVEVPVSENFKEEYLYDINNVIRMNPLFNVVQRLTIFYKEETNSHVFGCVAILENSFLKTTNFTTTENTIKFAVNTPRQNGGVFLLTFLFFYVIIVMF